MLTFNSAAKINYKNAFFTQTPELLYEPPLFLDETTIYFHLVHFDTKKRHFWGSKVP